MKKIIDIHGHLGNINFVPFWAADADKLAAYCRESGVTKLCLSASRAIMYDVREGNAELDAALKAKERVVGKPHVVQGNIQSFLRIRKGAFDML